MLFIHLFTDFMKHDHNKKKKIVILGRKEKVGACIFGIFFFPSLEGKKKWEPASLESFFSPPWKGGKSGGRSATVPHHTRLL